MSARLRDINSIYCFRDFYEKQRTGTAPADSTGGDRRDTCLKTDELYKCRTMFGRNVTCITGLTDQGNQI